MAIFDVIFYQFSNVSAKQEYQADLAEINQENKYFFYFHELLNPLLVTTTNEFLRLVMKLNLFSFQ